MHEPGGTGPGSWLVQTKLHPPLPRRETIDRARPEELLRSAVTDRAVTIVCAPAGYGKTTLLASLPRIAPDLRLAWVTLDEEENDSARFLGLMAAALRQLHPECGRSVELLLAGGLEASGQLRRAVGALVNDVVAHLPEPFALVLDDLHFLTEPAVYVALEYLLDHMPPQMRLVIGTRYDPPLPLARRAARRQLAELRRPDLAFTPAEAQRWLNEALGLQLSDADLAALQERTEGWAVGLCLLANSLDRLITPGERTDFLAGMSRSERYVFDFLADEVMRVQEPEIRRFLLQTSILTELTPATCRAVTGREDAAALLEDLYRRNLFLIAAGHLENAEVAYRYHALFAHFLRRQLEREMPAAVPDLHRLAAGAAATPGRAIAHYLAAGLWEPAAEAMEQAGVSMLDRGMLETLRTWYGSLPEAVRETRPRLNLIMGRCEIQTGDYPAAERLLRRAREAFAAAGDAYWESAAISTMMTAASAQNDFAAVRTLGEQAMALPLATVPRVQVHVNRSWLALAAGEWDQAGALLDVAVTAALESRDQSAGLVAAVYMSPMMMAVPACLSRAERFCTRAPDFLSPGAPPRLAADEQRAWLHLWRGEAAAARTLAEAGEAFRQRLGGYPVMGPDLSALLAVVCTAAGDLEDAGRHADRLRERWEGGVAFHRPFQLHALGRTLALLGRHDEARDCWHRLGQMTGGLGLPVLPYARDHLGGLLALLEQRYAEAEPLLARAAQAEERVPMAAAFGSALLLLARLRLEQHRPDAALQAVAPVLAEWERREMPGLALLDGAVGLPVLRLAAERGLGFAGRLLPLFGPGAAGEAVSRHQTPAPSLPEPLTQRELDVLRLLAAGATNREIARALYLGEETVKTYVTRLLRKLDATSRTQAAARARELGLT